MAVTEYVKCTEGWAFYENKAFRNKACIFIRHVVKHVND